MKFPGIWKRSVEVIQLLQLLQLLHRVAARCSKHLEPHHTSSYLFSNCSQRFVGNPFFKPSAPQGAAFRTRSWRHALAQYPLKDVRVPICANVFVRLFVCLPVCLFVCLFVYLILFDFICLSLYVVQRSYESYDIW